MRFRRQFTRAHLALFMLFAASSAFAQTLTTGDVAGMVTDATGAIVPGAAVTIKSVDTNEIRTAVANDSGQYRFSLLRPGAYTISAQTSGLKSNSSKYAVAVGAAQTMNLTLNVQGTQE